MYQDMSQDAEPASFNLALGVPLVVTAVMADGQIVLMAVAAFAQWLDVFECGVSVRHMRPADPARHHAMQLARYRFVDLVAGELEATQGFLLHPSSQCFGVGIKVFDRALGHTRRLSCTRHRRCNALDESAVKRFGNDVVHTKRQI